MQAKEVLMACLLMLLRLAPGEPSTVEYVRTLVWALLVWRDWHSAIPACCYSDEVNEASLAHLGRRWALHPELKDAESVMDLFLLIPQPSPEPP